MDKKRIIKIAVMALATALIWFSPVPNGLDVDAWQYFAIYVACILGIIFNPFNAPVTILLVLGIFSFVIGPTDVLSGYGGTTLWLVFSAFLISEAFSVTGLGSRIAYHLIGKFGKSTLGIGYALTITDCIIAPATPSNTARTGGIIWPIFSSVATALGSSAQDGTNNKVASYLTTLTLHVSLITGSFFITAMAANGLLVELAKGMLGIEITWLGWFKGQIVPGAVILLVLPWLEYKINPPEVKYIPEYKEISKNGLAKIGPMKKNEKILVVLFISALLLWATSEITKFNATSVALGFLVAALVSGILSWDDVLGAKAAWSTFIWYGGILGVSNKLVGAGFFVWFSEVVKTVYDFSSVNPTLLLIILILLGAATRYFLTNAAAYCSTIIPLLFTIGMLGGVDPIPLCFSLIYLASDCGILTHYGTLLVPLLVASGNVDKNSTWWKTGHIVVAFCIIVYLVIGIPYWKLVF